MATFHENLKQSFKNFKNKYIGNVPSGVTLAQINADLTEIQTLIERGGLMPELDFDNAVSLSNSNYVTSKKGAIQGTLGSQNRLLINNEIYRTAPSNQSNSVSIDYVGAGVTLALYSASVSPYNVRFIPYK